MAPLIQPHAAPTLKPTTIGMMIGEPKNCGNIGAKASADCAKLAATIADRANTAPPERSIPEVIMTWVTPTAIMPKIHTCKIMISRRWTLPKKLLPTTNQPSISNNTAMPTNTANMLASAGRFALLNMVTP